MNGMTIKSLQVVKVIGSNPILSTTFPHPQTPAKMAKSYDVIWERIRANPEKGVPVDIVNAFVPRVVKAVTNVKCSDEVYKLVKAGEGKTGILYTSRAAHPTHSKLVRVTFLLREYATTNESDTFYLRKYPPGVDLVAQLKLETMAPIEFGAGTQSFGQIY